MEPIVVRRHAGRWSVQDDPHTAPVEEYETRELAEIAARGLAEQSGREVIVHDDPDTPEGHQDNGDQVAGGPDAHTGAGTNIGVPDDEAPREPQAGL